MKIEIKSRWTGAVLYTADANLGGANLGGAVVAGCALGVHTFAEYLSTVVPALLTAGGKTVEQVVAAGAWECHSWNNSPLAVAFDVHSLAEVPALHRPRAEQFVSLFDAGLVPKPEIAVVQQS